jgi:putative flavoprotein involved in K+ transport
VTERIDVVVVGAGQAGLSTSHELTQAGVDHVVLERGRIGQTWRDRWDSFCLVTPNWTVQLPGGKYEGHEPDGYMPRDSIVSYLERYARSSRAPVREGVAVKRLGVSDDKQFVLNTNHGDIRASTVVLSTGAFQKAHRPEATASLPRRLEVIDAEDYRNPSELAAGKVLVIGSGQTGCQIAEELHEAGRDVFLSCGRAPWLPRRVEGRDVFAWLAETSYFEVGPGDPPSDAVRLRANPQNTGHGGGRDLHFRTLQAMGVTLVGHLVGADDRRAHFAADLADSVAFGDAMYADASALIATACATRGTRAPEFPAVPPFDANPPDHIDLTGFGAVVVTSGFRPDYRSWTTFPSAFDDRGFPIQRDGASTVVPGLFFCGVHYMRKRKSTLFMGVGEDAAIVARAVRTRVAAPSSSR